MTPEQRVSRLIRKWKARLGLADWPRIDGKIVPQSELTEESAANVWWDANEQTADIYISCVVEESELEACIVHELIHIVLDGDGPPKEYDVHHERKIAKLTRGLLRMKNA